MPNSSISKFVIRRQLGIRDHPRKSDNIIPIYWNPPLRGWITKGNSLATSLSLGISNSLIIAIETANNKGWNVIPLLL
ncbi:hypothetical protein JHK82_030010 [Glycine max]|uniref:Uncharacterized protein n=2 Tax=Glycine subgen. Soja TaxID=1462606 RepID=A0A0R0HBT8_SOYBN|nr:hypothetical protein JHK85_030631 [Glycine max]KAG4993270.1 hypothetical protein JHK86_030097 [Glycine max]KAG5123273.1 hypothetical protein JHK82_030010 [Glycine max]KAG5144687.1 hypothetical protein JHK84_030230 [Glycine max]RZB78220.1 hypothetical protein D0Y65_028913 [Glycine soja]